MEQLIKVAIASGKGGTGKTTIASNLAYYLAEEREVILVDLDVEEPNSGLFIKGELVEEKVVNVMIPEWDHEACEICGICQNVCNYNAILQLGTEIMVLPELCHSCYACSTLCPKDALPMKPSRIGELKYFRDGKLHFVEGRLDIGQEQSTQLIKETMKYGAQLAEEKRLLQLYDVQPGTACPVVESLREADHVVLVTEPTPFGLHDLTLSVDLMRELKRDFSVVLNRDGIGDDKVERYCEEQGIPIIARIPNMRTIAERYSAGGLLYQHVPEVKEALKAITTTVIESR